jgi:hypothetical protein
MVVVQGLDDFEADGDKDYTMKLSASSTDLYYDSNANASKDEYSAGNYTRRGSLPTVTVPLRNQDDDVASFVAMQKTAPSARSLITASTQPCTCT